MPRSLALLLLALGAFALLVRPGAAPPAAASSPLAVTSHVTYDLRPDEGPVRVSWEVSVTNNDPLTVRTSYYDNLSLPVLRGATNLAARSPSGASLAVAQDEGSPGPIAIATVKFDTRLFYRDSYSFSLTYELAAARSESLLVTPYYVYLPLLASGDEATVSLDTPSGPEWNTTVKPSDCAASGASTYTCSGSSAVYVAAFAEVARPSALASSTFDAALSGASVHVTLRYFPGEEAFANHSREVITAALPVIEDIAGFPYHGPPEIMVAQGGLQATLGNEGVTTCGESRCDIIVSPVGDDYTTIHELAHLWTGIFSKRWLAEGFAQLIAEDSAARLPAGLVQGQPPRWQPSSIDLQLDDWEDAGTGITATEEERLRQEAGYDRSLRFLYLLRFQLGAGLLKRVNAAIAAEGKPADSRHYLDLVEDTSGRRVDDLFAQWVFPPSYSTILAKRREARDRLAELERRAAEEGLSSEVPAAIRGQVAQWRFDEALSALDTAEAGLQRLDTLKADLSRLKTDAAAAGLALPETAEGYLTRWDFDGAEAFLRSARSALDAYTAAAAKVHAHRSLWQRFGLLGSDPAGTLRAAAAAFAAGDFAGAEDRAAAAAHTVASAGSTALRRLLIVGGVLAFFALVILAAVWIARLREREFA